MNSENGFPGICFKWYDRESTAHSPSVTCSWPGVPEYFLSYQPGHLHSLVFTDIINRMQPIWDQYFSLYRTTAQSKKLKMVFHLNLRLSNRTKSLQNNPLVLSLHKTTRNCFLKFRLHKRSAWQTNVGVDTVHETPPECFPFRVTAQAIHTSGIFKFRSELCVSNISHVFH